MLHSFRNKDGNYFLGEKKEAKRAWGYLGLPGDKTKCVGMHDRLRVEPDSQPDAGPSESLCWDRKGRVSGLSLAAPDKSEATETKVVVEQLTLEHGVPQRSLRFDCPLITVTKHCHFPSKWPSRYSLRIVTVDVPVGSGGRLEGSGCSAQGAQLRVAAIY